MTRVQDCNGERVGRLAVMNRGCMSMVEREGWEGKSEGGKEGTVQLLQQRTWQWQLHHADYPISLGDVLALRIRHPVDTDRLG